jgi:hypothetical protein
MRHKKKVDINFEFIVVATAAVLIILTKLICCI